MASAAKESALEKLRNKTAPDPMMIAERQAALAVREALAIERRTARQLAAVEAKSAKAAKLATRALKSEASGADTSPVEHSASDLKAVRDARYAARKPKKR